MKRRPFVILLVVAVGALTALAIPQRSRANGTDHFIITGAGPSGGPHVRVFKGDGTPTPVNFFAYDAGFTGGVRVATGDLNLDGTDEIVTGAGPGGGPHVRAFTLGGSSTNLGFFPYDAGFTGGVFVAAGAVTIDEERIPFIVTGAGAGGGPHVKVFVVNPETLEFAEALSFFPYDPSFTGGVEVAARDVNGDGNDEIITGAGPSGGPHVKVFEIQSEDLAQIGNFNAYGATFPGGVFVAGAAHAQKVVTGPGAGGGPDVRTFDAEGKNMFASFQAYGGGFSGGVRVAAGDLDDDGNDEIVTAAGPGGGPHVRAFNDDGSVTTVSFMAYNVAFTGGVYVAVGQAPAPPPPTSTSTSNSSTTSSPSSTTSTTAGSTTTSTTSGSSTTSTTSGATTTSTTTAASTTSTTCTPQPLCELGP